jgi:tetratricopeptide (TPR) repeat protein
VEEINKNDLEAPREISNLQRDKLMGIPPKRPAAAGPAAPQPSRMNAPTQEELDAKEKEKAAAAAKDASKIQLTPIQELQKQIQQDPVILFPYLKLADLYVAEDKFAEAEKTLKAALDVSGRDIKVMEKMEDVAMKRERHKVQIAELRAAKDPTDHNKELAQNLRNELMRQEMEVYRVRSDRYPDVARWKYELGTRLKRLGNLPEAIKMLEEAKDDEHRRSYVLLDLGECQQHLKQYEPAYENFVAGIEVVPSQNTDLRKLLLYRAGVLAVGLKRYDEGEKHLGKLASLDFNYKDVADRLDKLNKMRHKE